MVYSFARVGAVVAMDVEDYFQQGKRYWFRLHERGANATTCRHTTRPRSTWTPTSPPRALPASTALPSSAPWMRRRHLTDRRLHRCEVLAMVKRRHRRAGLPPEICCHTFRATGITAYLNGGGTLEHAQRIAAHESPRTTKLYDRTSDDISLDEIERIVL